MKLTRAEAVKIILRITDKDDPYWDHIVEEHYDTEKDDWPSVYDVLEPLGITKDEIDNN